MAVVSQDILQFTMTGSILSQSWSSVFHYSADVNGDTEELSYLLGLFTLAFNAAVLPLLSANVELRFTDAKNLTNGIDIASGTPTGVFGTSAGECLPAFVAWGFRLNRTTAATRHGHKRFPGVPEPAQLGGAPVAGVLDEIAVVEAFLAAPQVINDVTLWPVIVGRFHQDHAQAGELNLAVINSVASAGFIGITTQNTRKPGRGI